VNIGVSVVLANLSSILELLDDGSVVKDL